MNLIRVKEENSPSFMRLAEKECVKSPSNYKLGCVLVKGKRVLGRGFNHHRENKDFGSGRFHDFHAEGMAIYNALKVRPKQDIRGSIIYVYRKGHKIAKPCTDCQNLLKKYGIKKVYWSG